MLPAMRLRCRWLRPGFHAEQSAGRLGHHNLRTSGAGEGTFSQNRGHRIQHGTVTVMMDKEGFEVTTYRVDGEYHDGRHPDAVTFTRNLEEDLKRRDFTINAMAYHPEHGLVDLFGGLEDIDQKIIRCVGNPVERFTEDALRMLRAVRFSAQLGLQWRRIRRRHWREWQETWSMSAQNVSRQSL